MKKVVIVGGGPAGLMTAYMLSKTNNFQIQLFDSNKALARKFLVAGHGGFNLSNAENQSTFLEKYNHSFIKDAVSDFSNEQTIEWLSEIGIETFVGSSGKIFPKKGTKPITVLNTWLGALKSKKVEIFTEHLLSNFDGENVSFLTENEQAVQYDYNYLVFALGGASWKKTGSTGNWIELFQKKNIDVIPFQSSNAGISITEWKGGLGGGVLKNTEICIDDTKLFGEIELTSYGLEGAPVYALSHKVRQGASCLYLNLKPSFSKEKLDEKFSFFKGSKTDFLKEIKLSKSAIELLKNQLSKAEFLDNSKFLSSIQNLELPIEALQPIDEAISTVGGISMQEITDSFEMKKNPNHFCAGEMLDWDAPTGGYLLQACFAIGNKIANKIINDNYLT